MDYLAGIVDGRRRAYVFAAVTEGETLHVLAGTLEALQEDNVI